MHLLKCPDVKVDLHFIQKSKKVCFLESSHLNKIVTLVWCLKHYFVIFSHRSRAQLVAFVAACVTVELWSGCTFTLLSPPSSSLGSFVFFHILQPSAFPDVLPLFSPSLEMLTRLLSSPPPPTNPPIFVFQRLHLAVFIESPLCPYSQHLSAARELSACCCAVVWYMCVFGHSEHSGEPDWSGRSKQREETWQRKHTCTQTHSQILERMLEWSYYYCPVLHIQNLLRAWTWPWHKTTQRFVFLCWFNLLLQSYTMIHAELNTKGINL